MQEPHLKALLHTLTRLRSSVNMQYSVFGELVLIRSTILGENCVPLLVGASLERLFFQIRDSVQDNYGQVPHTGWLEAVNALCNENSLGNEVMLDTHHWVKS